MLAIACLGLMVVAGATAWVRSRISARASEAVTGGFIVALIAFVASGYAYALLTAEPHPDGPQDCAGPPYMTC